MHTTVGDLKRLIADLDDSVVVVARSKFGGYMLPAIAWVTAVDLIREDARERHLWSLFPKDATVAVEVRCDE